MKKVRAVHSKEFKESTMRMMESKGMSAREVEESLGVPAHTVRQWRRQIKAEGRESFTGKGRMNEKDAEIARLRLENRRLLAEREILKKRRSFCAALGLRYQFIVEHKGRWPVKWMCSALQVSVSGFYRWRYRKESTRSRRWKFLLVLIQESNEQNHNRYGYRRIHNELDKRV